MDHKNKKTPLVPIHTIDFQRCGARGKRSGLPCVQPAMKNGRCRFHGGKSTGARTAQGKERLKVINLKDGFYTAEAIAERKAVSGIFKEARALLKGF